MKRVKKQKKVSIIMGIYNCENTLSDCLESIIKQSYENWELIMCDDCSTDSTKEIAKKYTLKYENIFLIENQKNMKLAACLNNCLNLATGEYIARMDADDVCLPDRLKKQVEFLNENQDFAVVGSWITTFNGYEIKGVRKMKEIPTEDSLILGVPFAHPTIMMRKKIYDDLGGYTVSDRTTRGQDLDLWFRFYKKKYKGYNLQESLYMYRESLEDYKKRTMRAAWGTMKTRYYGYKLLGFSKIKYIFLIKPFITAVIPNKIMYQYHKKSSSKLNR